MKVANANLRRDLREDLASQIYEKDKLQKLFYKMDFDFSFSGISFKIEGFTPVSNISSIHEKCLIKEITILDTIYKVF